MMKGQLMELKLSGNRLRLIILVLMTVLLLGGYATASDTYILTIRNIKAYPLIAPEATISLDDFRYVGGKVQLNIAGLKFGVGNGASMLPVAGDDNIFIMKEIDYIQVKVGDFIVYETFAGLIVHQIVELGEDSNGWYADARGINNWETDLFRVRKESVRYRVMGIFY